jgi:hypothetical protein
MRGVEESLSIREQLNVSDGEAFNEVCIKSMAYDAGLQVSHRVDTEVSSESVFFVKFVDGWAKYFTSWLGSLRAAFWMGICAKTTFICILLLLPNMQLPKWSGS